MKSPTACGSLSTNRPGSLNAYLVLLIACRASELETRWSIPDGHAIGKGRDSGLSIGLSSFLIEVRDDRRHFAEPCKGIGASRGRANRTEGDEKVVQGDVDNPQRRGVLGMVIGVIQRDADAYHPRHLLFGGTVAGIRDSLWSVRAFLSHFPIWESVMSSECSFSVPFGAPLSL